MENIQNYIEQNRTRFEDDLCTLLRIPSISADPESASATREAAEWIRGHLDSLNLTTELIETDGHPLVYAESPPVADAPTVLVYGHYDVQPPDPLNEWHSPPFEPRRDGDNIVARGATDDKGQMLTHIFSVESWLRSGQELPLQIKFLIEGEEETGSESLYRYLKTDADKLQCDVIVVSDTSQFAPEQPAITYGLKGIAYFELTLRGPNQDLHSGTFGGIVNNPANALSKILSAIRDDRGRIQLPGFYDDVVALTDAERDQFASLDFDDQSLRDLVNVDELFGEEGFTTLERNWARPTFDVNGLTSGYQGDGPKTVLPAQASAKFSFRLVPDQDPTKIGPALEELIRENCPPGIQFSLHEYHSAPGFLVPLESKYIQAAADAIEAGFGKRPVFIRAGGSIPIVVAFREHLHADTLLLGWGQKDDNTHGPNEKFSLVDYYRGIQSSAHLWSHLARCGKNGN